LGRLLRINKFKGGYKMAKNLKEFALSLKVELENNFSKEYAKKIADKINKATHLDGSFLTEEEKKHIINYIQYPYYDHITGKCGMFESDNSEFLKLVAIIAKNIKKGE